MFWTLLHHFSLDALRTCRGSVHSRRTGCKAVQHRSSGGSSTCLYTDKRACKSIISPCLWYPWWDCIFKNPPRETVETVHLFMKTEISQPVLNSGQVQPIQVQHLSKIAWATWSRQFSLVKQQQQLPVTMTEHWWTPPAPPAPCLIDRLKRAVATCRPYLCCVLSNFLIVKTCFNGRQAGFIYIK